MMLIVTSGWLTLWTSVTSLRALLSAVLDHHVASSSVTGSAGGSPPLLHAESKPKPANNAPGINIDLMCLSSRGIPARRSTKQAPLPRTSYPFLRRVENDLE